MRRAFALAAAIVWLTGGCAKRDRSNPLDPYNDTTGGLVTGFNALAGDRQVEIRWSRVTQSGLTGYQLLRWFPGGGPVVVQDSIATNLTGTVDSSVVNDESYVYQVVARFDTGATLASPPDTATPGPRQITVLGAELPGFYGLTPDGRDILFVQPARDAYEDMELDERRGVLWLTIPLEGTVLRLYPSGAVAGEDVSVAYASDVSISDGRGYGWVADPIRDGVQRFGPSLGDLTGVFTPLGSVRVVEAGKHTAFVWTGDESGDVIRLTAEPIVEVDRWSVPGVVRAIALDEDRSRAWVVARPPAETGTDDLYLLNAVDSTVTSMPFRLANVADIEYDGTRQALWVSEEGPPTLGSGRLSRINDEGVIVASLSGIEPFGIHVDPSTGHCWVADLKSRSVLEVDVAGTVVRRTTAIATPYAVRVIPGDPSP